MYWDDKLNNIYNLEEGWDSYKAPKINGTAIENARDYIKLLEDNRLYPTRLGPSVVGAVAITIRVGTRKAFIEFYNNGSACRMLCDDVTKQLDIKMLGCVIEEINFIDQMKDFLSKGNHMLIIMQGWPGSGKSTMARKLAEEYKAVIHSTDDLFMENGVYNFIPEKLGVNHKQNQENACRSMSNGYNVIIDNTNIKAADCYAYVKHAVDLGIEVKFVRATGNWKSTHNVPDHAVERMKKQIEELTVEKVLATKGRR